MAGLTATQAVTLIAATLVAYVLNAAPCRLLVPGLTWPKAVAADLAARAVASTIPGPSDVATRMRLYRDWGIPSDAANAGIVFASFMETPLSSLVLPLLALIGVLVTGGTASPQVLALSVIGQVVLVLAALGLWAIVRSEAAARRVGTRLDHLAHRLWTLVRRQPPTGVVDHVLGIRERARSLMSWTGARAFVAAVAAKLAWFVVLEMSLLAVGVTTDILPPASVLTTMAVVSLVALVPITPGAVGVSEVAYVGLLVGVAGEGASGAITAAVLLFRVAQWLLPIPIGWLLLVAIRQRQLMEALH